MKTQAELHRHYWNVIEPMVSAYNEKHGSNVYLWECVKWKGMQFEEHPPFACDLEGYQFAVAILYDEQAKVHRPIFQGDEIFSKSSGNKIIVIGAACEKIYYRIEEFHYLIDLEDCLWHKPQSKRTFEINGVELPCPIHEDEGPCVVAGSNVYYFSSFEDSQKVKVFLHKLLNEALDK